ncbi:interferon-induced GTP-binding protein Mx3-like [Betta splendens]|uniref:Interferon-induced GTP-binding protein Mx n=1 Tax=Betta splendens TaxID=158456 RepID=A0A6P7MLS1_BETSP|nr:interferon-induced GTP-binding protein Mx3-like [Betta splendens]XP_055364849.1 interferon-induced GTP-binding protein Mx3-like [Betta splendens]
MNSLNQEFDEKVRPCIDLIDSLRSLGVEKDLALPAIAVIGDQSSGKSSVLEALSGVALPRGSGIVTRCPLELRMTKNKLGQEWYGKISYQDQMEEIKDPADVEKKIREAQDQMAGVGVGICKDLISLEIISPDVPDLTVIDLPGIARVAVNGQPENIGEQIKILIQEFITKQETISLVVVPSNVDIATTEALKMAQEVDPDGERTLGILTKPDLVDKGTEETVVDIVHNEVIQLKKGYMIVKCRGQSEILQQVSLPEATEREKAFFNEHAHFQVLYDEGHASIPKLAEKLTLELVHHIQKSLPRVKDQIKQKLGETQERLTKYNTGPPSDEAERIDYLFEKVTAFTQDAINLTSGENIKNGPGSNIFFLLRHEFDAWRQTIKDFGEEFNKNIEDNVTEFEKKYRGRELPCIINYKTFMSMVQHQMKELEEPAVLKLKDVAEIVKQELGNLAVRHFKGLPHLFNKAQMKIEDIGQRKGGEAESMLRTQFKMELTVYTQDDTYLKTLNRLWPNHSINVSDPAATLKEMMRHIKSYYEIVAQRLADQIPLVIQYHMLQDAATQLHREMMLMLKDGDNVDFLLQEDASIARVRDQLQQSYKRLSEARSRLMQFRSDLYDPFPFMQQ